MRKSAKMKFASPLDAKLFNLSAGALAFDRLHFLKPVKEVTLHGKKGPVHVMLARIHPTYRYLVTARAQSEEPLTLFCGKLTAANAEFVKYCQ